MTIHATLRDTGGNVYHARTLPDGSVAFSYEPGGTAFRTIVAADVLQYAIEVDMGWACTSLKAIRISTRNHDDEDLPAHRAIRRVIEANQ